MNLRYDMIGAHFTHGITQHPQTVMKELGITYEKGIPQSIADQWWFINCKNVPEELPDFLKPMGNATGN